MRIVAGSSSPILAKKVCEALKDSPEPIKLNKFSDSEMMPEFERSIREKEIFIVQSTSAPVNDAIMEMILMIDAAKRSSARKITAVIPYYGYARQDRTTGRTPISAKVIADMLTAVGANRVVTMDLHSKQIEGFFNIPIDNLRATKLFANDIKEKFSGKNDRPLIIAPDAGGVQRAQAIAKRLGLDLAVIDKRRQKANVIEKVNILGNVEGEDCILIDDIGDTLGTLCKAAEELMKKKAKSVTAYVTHPVFSGNAIKNVKSSPLKEIVITDTIDGREKIAPKVRSISVAPLIAHALQSIHKGLPLSDLYND